MQQQKEISNKKNRTKHKHTTTNICIIQTYRNKSIVCISQQIFEQFFNFGSDLLLVLGFYYYYFYFKFCQIFLITFLDFKIKTEGKKV